MADLRYLLPSRRWRVSELKRPYRWELVLAFCGNGCRQSKLKQAGVECRAQSEAKTEYTIDFEPVFHPSKEYPTTSASCVSWPAALLKPRTVYRNPGPKNRAPCPVDCQSPAFARRCARIGFAILAGAPVRTSWHKGKIISLPAAHGQLLEFSFQKGSVTVSMFVQIG